MVFLIIFLLPSHSLLRLGILFTWPRHYVFNIMRYEMFLCGSFLTTLCLDRHVWEECSFCERFKNSQCEGHCAKLFFFFFFWGTSRTYLIIRIYSLSFKLKRMKMQSTSCHNCWIILHLILYCWSWMMSGSDQNHSFLKSLSMIFPITRFWLLQELYFQDLNLHIT